MLRLREHGRPTFSSIDEAWMKSFVLSQRTYTIKWLTARAN